MIELRHVSKGFWVRGEWQPVIEWFYRWQIGPMVQISPEAQMVFGEGLEPGHPFRLVAGLRAQISF